MDWRVTSPTRGPPPPCKQALRHTLAGLKMGKLLCANFLKCEAGRHLGVIRWNFRHTSRQRKFKLYCSLVRPKLENPSSASAWYPYLQKDTYQLDML